MSQRQVFAQPDGALSGDGNASRHVANLGQAVNSAEEFRFYLWNFILTPHPWIIPGAHIVKKSMAFLFLSLIIRTFLFNQLLGISVSLDTFVGRG
jgi:hypothetical protein